MRKKILDTLDKSIIASLSRDGSTSITKISEITGSSSQTVRSRLSFLYSSNIINSFGGLNIAKIKNAIFVYLGIRLRDRSLILNDFQNMPDKYEFILDCIADIDQVVSVTIVTGKYDIMAEGLSFDGMEGVFSLIYRKLNMISGIRDSESFTIMKSRNKWVNLPTKMLNSFQQKQIGIIGA